MILLIDNYDSFTFNIWQLIAGLGYEVKVVAHDAITLNDIEDFAPSHIVISPGPKSPQDSGISIEVIRHFYKSIPILGVCLGHQCIGAAFGVATTRALHIMHGKVDQIFHDQQGVFRGLPSPFNAARYHSLVLAAVPEDFVQTAWVDDGSIMGIQHRRYPVHGVQFHPESFMSEHGEALIRNFLA